MKVTLTILEEDLRSCKYIDAMNCPITRALKRAGHPSLYDAGFGIEDTNEKNVVQRNSAEKYNEMVGRVIKMGAGIMEPQTFKVTLNLDI